MRSLVIILATVALLTGGFGVYWWQQKPGSSAIDKKTPPVVKTPRPTTSGGLGPAQGVWMNMHGKDGRRTARVRADQYDPMPDDRVKVRNLELEIFLADGQVLYILGKSGIINMQQGLNRGGAAFGANMNLSPSRGHLKDVTLLLFPNTEAAEAGQQDITITMNNASFDNEALKVQTEDFVDPATKKTVPGDEVPVHARGKYNFDGRGLEIRWNDRDRHLEFLKVFHGERLEIMSPGDLMDERAETPSPTAVTSSESAAGGPLPGVMLVASDKKSGVDAARRDSRKPTTAASRPHRSGDRSAPVYRAVFSKDVHIVRGTELDATADQLQVDFRPKEHDPADRGTGESADPASRASGDTRPTTRRRAPASRASTQAVTPLGASTQPTTQPDQVPVVVTWTGPLVVTPLEQQGSYRIMPGQAVGNLIGHPKVRQEGLTATAGTMQFRTLDRSFEMGQTPGNPVVLTDVQGARIVTPKLDFSQGEQRAHLIGPSSAKMPMTEQGATMSADWTEQCTLLFERDGAKKLTLHRAEIRGNVYVQHPQLRLKSRELTMAFDKPDPSTRPATQPASPTTRASGIVTQPAPATQQAAATTNPSTKPSTRPAALNLKANLRQLDATGDVHCELQELPKPTTQPAGNPPTTVPSTQPVNFQTIDCNHLELLTAKDTEGKLYPAQVIADGNVHTTDPKQEMWCGRLLLKLNPSTRPSTQPSEQMARAELSSLLADENVRVLTRDGGTARSTQLIVKQGAGQQSVMFVGQPAVVEQQGSTLTGPILQFYPDTKQASVLGAGTLKSIQQEGATTRPVDVKWQAGLNADGLANQVDCLENVSTAMVDADGTLQTTQSDRVKLILYDPPPSTQPSTKPTTKKSTTKPSSRPASMDVMGPKRIKQINLIDNAIVTSTLLDAEGKLLRGMQLRGSQVQHDVITRRLLVPVPGQLTMEDHTPPRKSDPNADPGQSTELKGQTAVVWEKQLDYNPDVRKAIVEGNVRVRHEDDGDNGKQFELSGEKFVADLEPVPTTRPSSPSSPPKMRMRYLHGEGSIVFRTTKNWVEASAMDYDPIKHQLTLRGTNRRQARELYTDGPKKGMERATFDEAIFDTEKWQIVDMKPFRLEIRRGGDTP